MALVTVKGPCNPREPRGLASWGLCEPGFHLKFGLTETAVPILSPFLLQN